MKIAMTTQEAIGVALNSRLHYQADPYQAALIDAAFQTLDAAIAPLCKTPWNLPEDDRHVWLMEGCFAGMGDWRDGDDSLYTPQIVAWIWDNLDSDGWLPDAKLGELRALKDAQRAN